ncbi:MAG TPA: hypothetical protein VFX89_08155 [Gammaproteobacteria bacterium]|nr:hypothetical protein [Gammaproteobacteria bacterium]
MTPEEIDRVLLDEAAGVRASRDFSASVMAAVRREPEPQLPPPIPFPWARAWPGLAAVGIAVVAAWFAMPPSMETSPPVAERAVEAAQWLAGAAAVFDSRWVLIAAVVSVVTVVPALAPLWLVSYRRGS